MSDFDQRHEGDPAAVQHAAQARTLLNQRKLADAQSVAEAALQIDPNCAEAHLVLGEVMLETPDGGLAALGHFDAVATEDPTSTAALLGRARAQAALGQRAEANAGCRAVLALEPELGMANVLLGKLLLTEGNVEEALTAFEAAKKDAHARWRALLGAASCLRALGRHADALTAVMESRREDPSPESAFLVAELHSALGDPDLAVVWFREAVRASGENEALKTAAEKRVQTTEQSTAFALAKARRAVEGGKIGDALAIFEKLIAESPEDTDVLREYATALARAERIGEALETIDRAIAAEPDNPKGFDQKVVILGRLGKYAEAIAILDVALEQHPDNAPLLTRRGNFAARLGRFEEAQIFLRRARQSDPRDPEAWLAEAEVMQRLGRKDAALTSIESFLADPGVSKRHREQALRFQWQLNYPSKKLDPQAAEAAQLRGYERMKAGNAEAALAQFSEATQLNPFSMEHWNNRGACNAALKRYEDALTCFDKALELRPDHRATLGARAEVLTQLGRCDEAIAIFDQLLAWLPNDPKGLRGRGKALSLRPEPVAPASSRAAEEPPPDGDWASQAAAHVARGDYAAALPFFERACEAEPQNPLHWKDRANCLLELGRARDAVTFCENALSIDRYLADAWFVKGCAEQSSKRVDAAVRSFQHFLALNYPPHEERQKRAREFLKSRNAPERDILALGLFDGFIEPFRNSTGKSGADQWRTLAEKFILERPDLAFHCFGKLLEVEPLAVEAWFFRGVRFAETGEFGQAKTSLQRYVELARSDPPERVQQAKALIRKLGAA